LKQLLEFLKTFIGKKVLRLCASSLSAILLKKQQIQLSGVGGGYVDTEVVCFHILNRD
jgi:hypothetical protein